MFSRVAFCRAVMAFGLLSISAGPALAEIGRVKRVTGAAFVERGGRRIVPSVGATLDPGDRLITGPDGRISVTFIDNSRFSAGPGSVITLTRFEYDRNTHRGAFVAGVDRGALAVVSGQIAKENPNAMRVRTPTSLLGVRGTRFVVTVE
jgi:hypothetical protein